METITIEKVKCEPDDEYETLQVRVGDCRTSSLTYDEALGLVSKLMLGLDESGWLRTEAQWQARRDRLAGMTEQS